VGSKKLIGVVLCGGESSRFGSDKALAIWRDKALVDHAIETLRPLCGSIVLLAGRSPHRFWGRLGDGVEVSSDPGKGPAEALRFQLVEKPKPSLVIAVDMPFLDSDDLRAFLDAAAGGCAVLGDAKATLPCLLNRDFLSSDQPSMRASLKQIKAQRISAESLGLSDQALGNINRAEELPTR
jgi:molybdopterin-guanine dinucleotide biosynthesis protein A